MVLLFFTTYISVDHAHHKIFHAKVGKGGLKTDTPVSDFHHSKYCEF